MVWELVAMWLIAVAAIVWFVRDERQRKEATLREQAQRFATKPHYRSSYLQPDPEPEPIPTPLPRPTLSAANRAFLEDFVNRARADA